MTDAEQEHFDALLGDVIAALPPRVRALIDEVPIIALDQPTPEMVTMLRADGLLGPEETGEDLCGLHTGVGITDRSLEDPAGWGSGAESAGPEQIHLFRDGIVGLAEGWDQPKADEIVQEEIRITLLHEIGHHFGLDEDDLDELGFS